LSLLLLTAPLLFAGGLAFGCFVAPPSFLQPPSSARRHSPTTQYETPFLLIILIIPKGQKVNYLLLNRACILICSIARMAASRTSAFASFLATCSRRTTMLLSPISPSPITANCLISSLGSDRAATSASTTRRSANFDNAATDFLRIVVVPVFNI